MKGITQGNSKSQDLLKLTSREGLDYLQLEFAEEGEFGQTQTSHAVTFEGGARESR